MDANVFLEFGAFLKLVGLILSPVLLLPLLVLIAPKPLAPAAHIVSKVMDGITGVALVSAMLSALLLLVSMLAVVFLRYVYSVSFTWLNELAIYAFAAMFMLGAAAALRDDAHVRVDILRPRFGETGRSWIELAGIYLFLFPICIRLLDLGESDLARSWSILEPSRESDGLHAMFLFKTLLPAFALLMIGQGVSEALKSALRVNKMGMPETHGDVHGA